MPIRDHKSHPFVYDEAQFKRVVAAAFRENGWRMSNPSRKEGGDLQHDFIAERPGQGLIIKVKRASEGRRDRVIPLLSQAALEAAYSSRRREGKFGPVAIVVANQIPDSVAEQAKKFLREHFPEVAVGLLDLEGLRSFAGYGLESLNAERRAGNREFLSKSRSGAPRLFSDLNQWMLKVMLAPGIPEPYLSAPRGSYRGASELARAANVSVMSAFRFIAEFSKEGFLDQSSGRLRVVRSGELMSRWQAAGQRRASDIPMRWILNKGKNALHDALRSYLAKDGARIAVLRDRDSEPWSPRSRVCLGLFAAAEALGLGFVHGVESYIYLDRLGDDVAEQLGLSANGASEHPDVYVRIPGNRESVFRSVVMNKGLPSSDILQVWLDVSEHPSRGQEQANLVWRRVLGPALEASV